MDRQIFIVVDDEELRAAFEDFYKANEFIEAVEDHGLVEETLGRPWLSPDGPTVEEVTVHTSVNEAVEEFNKKWRVDE